MLKIVSKDENTRMIYNARQAEIMDQSSMLKDAMRKGEKKKAVEIARNMISISLDIPIIAKVTGLSEEEVTELMNQKN